MKLKSGIKEGIILSAAILCFMGLRECKHDIADARDDAVHSGFHLRDDPPVPGSHPVRFGALLGGHGVQ